MCTLSEVLNVYIDQCMDIHVHVHVRVQIHVSLHVIFATEQKGLRTSSYTDVQYMYIIL